MTEESLDLLTINPEHKLEKFTVLYVDQEGTKTLEKEIMLESPFVFDKSPFIPDDGTMDLAKFYQILGDVVENAQQRVVEKQRIKVVKDFQPEDFHNFGDEVITTRVLKREPAKMNRKGTDRPNRTARFTYSLISARYPNKVLIVESRPIDHKIEISCWGKTATLADSRALWLERLLISNAWAFKIQGVDRFFWEGRGPDTLWKHQENRLHQRSLFFFVRLIEPQVKAVPQLKQINFDFALDSSEE